MIVEIQFHDDQGSICPYCGEFLQVAVRRVEAENMHRGNYEVRLYPCVCPRGHFVFVTTETISQEDNYIFVQRMFAYYQDWEEHVDMTITNGAYEVPLLDSEDDAWQIHLKALKLTQNPK